MNRGRTTYSFITSIINEEFGSVRPALHSSLSFLPLTWSVPLSLSCLVFCLVSSRHYLGCFVFVFFVPHSFSWVSGVFLVYAMPVSGLSIACVQSGTRIFLVLVLSVPSMCLECTSHAKICRMVMDCINLNRFVLCCPVISCVILSCVILPYSVLSWLILSFRVLS